MNLTGSLCFVDFPNYPETWIGEWKKDTHRLPCGEIRDITKCSFCTSSDDLTARKGALRSYRVLGITKPDQFWDWPVGAACTNKQGCWGPNIRKWTVLKSSSEEWVFRTSISSVNEPNRSSLIDEIRVKLKQQQGSDRLLYTGFTSGDRCRCFWPLLDEPISFWPVTKTPYRKIIVNMTSGEQLPPDSSMRQQMSVQFMFANMITFRFFEQEKVRTKSGLSVAPKVSK